MVQGKSVGGVEGYQQATINQHINIHQTDTQAITAITEAL